MAETVYFLTADDVIAIKKIIEAEKNRGVNNYGRPKVGTVDHEEQQAPEVYVARTPQEGIDGLVADESGNLEDSLNYADCDIYRLNRLETSSKLERVGTLSKRVYNLSTTSVQGDRWVPVARDKCGSWYVMGADSAGGFWARIVSKKHTVGEFIEYTCNKLNDIGTIDWEDGDPSGVLAYEVNDVDLPISSSANLVVFLKKGAGDYYLFEQQPLWEDVYLDGGTTEVGGTTYLTGSRVRYHQTDKEFCLREDILILLSSSIPVNLNCE